VKHANVNLAGTRSYYRGESINGKLGMKFQVTAKRT